MAKQRKYRVTGEGVCNNCGGKTEQRQHIALTDKQVRAPFFYSKWYYCHNPNCKTTTIMYDQDRVWNKNGAAEAIKRIQEEQETISFLRNL